MIGDSIRMHCYVQALKRAIDSDSIVVDLGTGTGMIAMVACSLGAKRVYAIDYDDSIVIAKQLAVSNDLADRIEFIKGDSREIELPEKADVLVSDLRDVLPLHSHHIATLVDARRRFMNQESHHLIPLRDSVYCAVAEAAGIYERYTSPWGENDYGLKLDTVRDLHVNTWVKARVKRDALLTAPGCLFELDYTKIEEPNIEGSTRLQVKKSGTGHGLSVWFDAEISEGLAFSNAPGAPDLGYSMGFFPWTKPVALKTGDIVDFHIDARLVDSYYIWTWKTRISSGDKETEVFEQSTFFGEPLMVEAAGRLAGLR